LSRPTVGSVPSARDSWEFPEGDEISPGRYAVRLLGGGHRYEAYLAWDDELLTLVAVKILRPHLVADAVARASLEREAHALAALAHTAVVRSFDHVLAGPRPHLVLEFLDGPRLSTLIRRYGVIVEQLLPLALEVCSALHYMSARGFVHLDVKPRNIVMSAPPRLIDLSVATEIRDLHRVESQIGTDAYMSPEQCDPRRFSEIGPPADIWGLGVTLFEALARTRPFPDSPGGNGSSLTARYPQLVAEPASLPSSVPAALAAVIRSCLEKQPENRPLAAELAQELEPWVAALPRPRLGLFRPGGRVRASVFD
jgi:eukaryotic-like serine/threonine-protein kinase